MFFYNLVIRLYGFVIKLAALKKTKAKQWVSGRKNWKTVYSQKASELGEGKRIWIHCASYGEFEQGRPLIDAIREKYPAHKIILSFFSPSGYEAFKSWKGVDLICYLPLDTQSNARDFLNIIQPSAAIFIKYEFWLNFLFELKKQNIPAYLVSAVFKPHHPFFRWYGGIFIRSLHTFNRLFIQDENSGRLLQTIGITNFEVSGDTRYDRVLQIRNSHQPLPFFEQFCSGCKVIIAGSSWPKDEELLLDAFLKLRSPGVKLILVPHEIGEKFIEGLVHEIEKRELSYAKYSDNKTPQNADILIVDAMGLLSRIYFYGHCAYIGGGFNGGLHNTLEAAVYGLPVVFYGDEHFRYNEVEELIKIGAAFNVQSAEDCSMQLKKLFHDEAYYRQMKYSLEQFFGSKHNVSEQILRSVEL